MADCLEDDPDKRPNFEELDTRLKRIDAETSQDTTKTSTVPLFDIFPRHVAQALKEGRKVEPEHHDAVTIVFSDIVGLTEISSSLEPRKIADLLARLYTKLDALSSQFDVFKVESIGDTYMLLPTS